MYHQSLHSSPKSKRFAGPSKPGVTLIELTVVILVLLALIGASMYSMSGYKRWQRASEAATTLRSVYTAQRTYLAEHPLEDPATLTAAKILPYMSDGSTAMPTVEDLEGNQLAVDVTKFPPVVDDGGGGTYDPSGKSDDGQWDVGD